MKNSKFRTPLLQSAAILGGVVIVALIAASSGSAESGGGILSVLAGIGHAILFVIGMAISLALCIAILIGIFLAAVGMVSPEQAGQMYRDLKKKSILLLLSWSSTENDQAADRSRGEDIARMRREIHDLQETNRSLSEKIEQLEGKKDLK